MKSSSRTRSRATPCKSGRGLLEGGKGSRLDPEPIDTDKASRPQSPQRIFTKAGRGILHRSQAPCQKVLLAPVRIQQHPGGIGEGQGIDGKIAPLEIREDAFALPRRAGGDFDAPQPGVHLHGAMAHSDGDHPWKEAHDFLGRSTRRQVPVLGHHSQEVSRIAPPTSQTSNPPATNRPRTSCKSSGIRSKAISDSAPSIPGFPSPLSQSPVSSFKFPYQLSLDLSSPLNIMDYEMEADTKSSDQSGVLMKTVVDPQEAVQVMAEANRIIEDFSTMKYGLYALLFLLEIALCFWVASKI